MGQMAGVGLSAVCEFLPLGRKIREALTRAGCNFFSLEEDWSESKRLDSLVAKPSYEASSALGLEILEKYLSGEYERIVLVYNSFISAGKQLPVVETLLPLSEEAGAWQSDGAGSAGSVGPIVKKGEEYMSQGGNSGKLVVGREYIFEPSAMQIAKELLPKLVCLKLHAAILDSQAAEHAARTLAMQLSSDNAQKLLSELTLEYNKARQQQITAEILDLAAGAL